MLKRVVEFTEVKSQVRGQEIDEAGNNLGQQNQVEKGYHFILCYWRIYPRILFKVIYY